MTRRSDLLVGVALFVVAAFPVVFGALLGVFTLLIVGLVALGVVLPICYKLIRYPSTRQTSLGEIVSQSRMERFGRLTGGGMLVCFSGIDGSGKTTQAQMIIDTFSEHGVSATHVWARWRPFVSYPLMGILYVLLGWRRKDYHRSRFVRAIWGYFLFVDQLLFFAREIYPELLRGKVVCIDRYVLDQIVEMRYDGLYNRRVASLLERFLPTPDVAFLMDVPPEEAMRRKDDTQEMLDRLRIDVSAEEYLADRRGLYLETVDESRTVVVDTTRPVSETHEKIAERVLSAYFEF